MSDGDFAAGSGGASPRVKVRQNTVPRATCSVCGLEANRRTSGAIGEHRVLHRGPINELCDGGGKPPRGDQ